MMRRAAVFAALLAAIVADAFDYYELLGLERGSAKPIDLAAVKSAYRRRSLELHPDKNLGDPDAASKFQQLQEAFETLKDPESLSYYNKHGRWWREMKRYHDEVLVTYQHRQQFRPGVGMVIHKEPVRVEELFWDADGVSLLHPSHAAEMLQEHAGVWVVFLAHPRAQLGREAAPCSRRARPQAQQAVDPPRRREPRRAGERAAAAARERRRDARRAAARRRARGRGRRRDRP